MVGVASPRRDARSSQQQQLLLHEQQMTQQKLLDSDSADGNSGDDRSDIDGDDGADSIRGGKRKRPISVSYVSLSLSVSPL